MLLLLLELIQELNESQLTPEAELQSFGLKDVLVVPLHSCSEQLKFSKVQISDAEHELHVSLAGKVLVVVDLRLRVRVLELILVLESLLLWLNFSMAAVRPPHQF